MLNGGYAMWKTLNRNATGLGRDPATNTIVADDDYWAAQIS